MNTIKTNIEYTLMSDDVTAAHSIRIIVSEQVLVSNLLHGTVYNDLFPFRPLTVAINDDVVVLPHTLNAGEHILQLRGEQYNDSILSIIGTNCHAIQLVELLYDDPAIKIFPYRETPLVPDEAQLEVYASTDSLGTLRLTTLDSDGLEQHLYSDQDIGPLSTPTFQGLILSNPSAETVLQMLNGASVLEFANQAGAYYVLRDNFSNSWIFPQVGNSTLATINGNQTFTSAIWNGTKIGIAYGGTGATTASGAINNLLPSQTGHAAQFLTTDGSSVSWVTVSGGSGGSGAALTTTDDTNVTLTLGGTPTTALVNAASITVGWAGTLDKTRQNSATAYIETANTWVKNQVFRGAADGEIPITSQGKSVTDTADLFRAIAYNGTGLFHIDYLGKVTTGIWNGTAISETFGGTNQTSYTTGDILYSSATNTLSKLAANSTATKKFLTMTSSVPAYFDLFDGANTWTSVQILNPGTSVTSALLVSMAALGSTNHIDSHFIQMMAQAYDSSAHEIDWKFFVDATSDAGASTFVFQNRIGGAGYGTKFSITDGGVATATTFSGALSGNATTATALATGRTISISGDLTYTSPSFDGSGNVTAAGTLATVNSDVGTYGSVTKSAVVTVNGKGLITAISESTITPAATSITGTLGTDHGGTNLSTIAAGSILAANSLDTLTAITSTSGTVYLKNVNGTISWDTGTGAPSDAQYVTLATDATLTVERVLTGTANQVVITDNGAGSTVVLSLPQSIATTSTPQFLRMSLGATISSVASLYILGTKTSTAPSTTGGFFHSQGGTYTDNSSSSGTIATAMFNSFWTPVYAATNVGVTVTDAATVYIEAAPSAGTNVTLTNKWALYIAAGNAKFAGSLTLGTALGAANGGTGVANNAASTITISGNYATTFTVTGTTGVTLPTTGTLATLAGTETFTNKTLTSPKLNENVAVTTTATQLNYITSATGTTGTTSTNIVFSTSPTLTTPILGVASATSLTAATLIGGTGTTSTLTLEPTTSGSATTGADIIFNVGTSAGTQAARIFNNGDFLIGTGTTHSAQFHVIQTVATSGSPQAVIFKTGAHTTLTMAEYNPILFDISADVEIADTGAGYTNQRYVLIKSPSIHANGLMTVTTAATVYIEGPPKVTTSNNLTISNAYGLYIDTVDVTPSTTTVTNAYGLYVKPPTGAATTNISAFFTGETWIGGTLQVATDVLVVTTSSLNVKGGKFTVETATGNTVVAGTLSVTGDVAVNTNKFTVTASSGNTVVAGTLGITGDVTVNTDKFTVAASSGNTVVAGTLTVTGALSGSSSIKSSSASAGIGYATGAGSTVSQGSGSGKATGVTINALCGQITTDGASMVAGSEATFTVTNSSVAATDIPMLCVVSGGTAGAYGLTVSAVAAGSFNITVSNQSSGAKAETIVIGFAVLKGVTS